MITALDIAIAIVVLALIVERIIMFIISIQ